MWIQWKLVLKDTKTWFWPILALFRVENGPKIWPLWTHILHNSKSSSLELKNIFTPYSGPKRTQKYGPLRAHILHASKSTSSELKKTFMWTQRQYWGANTRQMLKQPDKNWGSLFDLKKSWWTMMTEDNRWQTAWHQISFADYVSSRAKNWSVYFYKGIYDISTLSPVEIYRWLSTRLQ